ncbi:chromosome segregation protein SMC [uncultured Thiohalocapsa sp.]|uniref:chromosome segregation protein SMC n=1 Tax=uncultured Thiohalocapsa sp. TaxID=768990 RepID=UPI0025EE15F5|nr:chromosome segregation protein SMC [uncultured Thiohalocapsa sp.]
MRLEKIKLTGFKSFVDATTVSFPSNLVGVVGPNGCGKSNVIDAVRWVMGESSAKMLRGASMADVIFNGSTSRKPVGVAGIELTFDNSAGRAGGEFARFNEIAVKRQISRDGQSTYFLNGARCRRRDIQDLFLGTGLGPRSYAIIEQGMISRFIEAKPDELRLFIEEAAGISRYKERRRETENRIRHTRENLDRLNDLRDEVAKQLQHLERQAETAEKYRQLKADARRLEDELTALRWRELDQELGARDRAIGELTVDLERRHAEQRRLEAQIETDRDAHAEAADAFNLVQGRYYSVGAEIARLEQAIRYADDNRNRREVELKRVRDEFSAAQDHRARDNERMVELRRELERDEPALTEVGERLAAAADELAGAEAALDAWQSAWDALQEGPGGPTERAQTERGRINDLEQRITRAEQRAARIAEDRAKLDTVELASRLEQLQARSDILDEQIAAAADNQARSTEALRQLEEARTAVAARLDAARTELQTCRGRQASLEALQDAALEQGDDAVSAWIEAQGLGDVPRLVDSIEVDSGWEAAAEAVLGDLLAALCVADLDTHGPQLDCGPLGLLGPGLRHDLEPPAPQADALARRVRCPWPLHGLLHGIRTTNTLAEALSRRGELAPGERIVTRDGAQVGRDWLTRPGDGPRVAGTLARAETLRALQAQSDELDGVIADLMTQHDGLAERRQTLEQARDDALDTVSRLSRERAALDAEVGAGRSRLEHMRERIAVLDAELAELAEWRAEAAEDIETARERLHQALEETELLAAEREALGARRTALRSRVAEARAAEGGLRDERQRLEVAIQTRRASLDALEGQLARGGEQLASLGARRDELLTALTEAAEPVAEQREQLQAQLEQRVAVEADLGDARARMEALDQSVREAEQRRHGLEQAVAGVQQDLDGKRLERQERLVRRRTLEEQLAERGAVMSAVVAGLGDAASSAEHEQALAQVKSRIERLGNINLAAIDEFREQSERMRYLDAQHADISAALETLEAAIRKIDRETRARFQDTFERISQGLQQLFPRVFGGGHAYLELTGDDLLDTGVAIMARPPGKRNASIHLLSGGEKALTAVALVFAIFQLNPAPFCMLDEVDAPLDDANVGRFCELVRSLSDQVQFIFITHNKVTMEIADHLIGVTMHEPGVSRLVAVDVDEAAKLAAVS